MNCKNCGHEISDENKYCPTCGKKITLPKTENNNAKDALSNASSKIQLFGFRSDTWYKKIIALLYLVFMFIFFLVAIFASNDTATLMQDKVINRLSNIVLWLTAFLPYLIMSNFFGLKAKLPLYKSRGKFPKIVAVFLTMFILLICYGNINSLHTQEYKDMLQEETEQVQVVVEDETQMENEELEVTEEQQIEEQEESEAQEEVEVAVEEVVDYDSEVIAETLDNELLYIDFVNACSIIGLDITEIKNFEQIADWAYGTRYNFTYERLSMHLYNNADTVVSIKVGNSVDVYKQFYEPYQIEEYIPDENIIAELKVKAEDLIKEQLNYPSTANFSIFDFAYGRVSDEYILQNTVTAQNAFGVKEELSCDVRFYVSDESYSAVYIAIGGSVILDKRTEDAEREQISGFVEYTISEVPDDILILSAEEVYADNSLYDQTKIAVKGEVIQIVSYTDMTGYYLFGVRGNGLVCWVYTTQEYDIGDTVTFYGTVYSGSNVEVSDCVVIE